MTTKVFISYSHADECHMRNLCKHLSGLQSSNCIDVWHDRKIGAGDNWKGQIDSNIRDADIILFLVSSDFMSSAYCQDVEVRLAMERHKNEEARVIPIVVRACVWDEKEFSSLQGVPKDAKAVTTWNDIDSAWVDVVSGIRTQIQDHNGKKFAMRKSISSMLAPKLREDFHSWLLDTEITLTHRVVSSVSLPDIYVEPDLEVERENLNDLVSIKNSVSILSEPGKYLVSGEEQQGKTALLKMLYLRFLSDGYAPVFISASEIGKSDAKSALELFLDRQYEGLSVSDYCCLARRIVLVDNIDEVKLNSKYRTVFLSELADIADTLVVTCHESFLYDINEVRALDSFSYCKLLGLGNKKREEIVKRWISLGRVESIDEFELYSKCDDLKGRLDAIIKKNIVPPKPIYLLMFLQWFEANAQLNLDLTSYGHCYQQLIYQAFDKAKVQRGDFDKYLNVLTELSWWIFKNGRSPNDHELASFFVEYCNTYLSVDKEQVIEKMIQNSILIFRDGGTGFKYPYIYYFFAGKKIAEYYSSSEEVKCSVDVLLDNLHREDYANILIFITHHTKDLWVLNKIKGVLSGLFGDQKPASLDKDQLRFMEDFVRKIPEMVIEQREVHKERDARNERLDEIERTKANDHGETESPDILANINKAFKGMEVAGQIIRNRHASLTRNALTELGGAGADTGLRFLDYFIAISDAARSEVVKIISDYLEDNPRMRDRDIEKYAELTFLHMTYGVISAVIKKIASAIGSKEAGEIYERLSEESGTPASTLIALAIELQFGKVLNIQSVERCHKKIENNPVCVRILKEIVIQHTYLFPVPYQDKQRISELLKVSMKTQRLLDQHKRGKG